MSTIRSSLFVIAVTATATLAWADGESAVVSDEALPEPLGVFVWVTVPPEVPASRLLTVHILIRNRRQSEPYTLEDIDISDRFLDGFEVDTITPEPVEIDHSSGTLTLEYGLDIGAQRSEEFLINLRAMKVGIFSGDLDVWSNDSDECATRRLQTEIVVEPER